MNEECLICKASLEYLEADTMMECVICHKKENSKTRCVNGHYVCCECHTSGMDEIIALALNEKSKKTMWIYIRTEKLNKLLEVWSLGKPN